MIIPRLNITEQALETYLSAGIDDVAVLFGMLPVDKETLLVGGPPAGVPDVVENNCAGQAVLGGLEAASMP